MPYDIIFYQSLEGPHPVSRHTTKKTEDVPFQERHIRMSHRRAIGLVTSFISGRFFEQLMSGLQTVAQEYQVDVLVIHGTPEHVALTQIGQQRVDGWLVLTYFHGLELLAQQGKPIVTISG